VRLSNGSLPEHAAQGLEFFHRPPDRRRAGTFIEQQQQQRFDERAMLSAMLASGGMPLI
jgi:hypothetical protein